MATEPETVAAVRPAPRQNMTVRDGLIALAKVSDMDAELCITFYNSDPIPVQTIEESEDGPVVITGG
ncbi:hypothetical protein LCGC14_1322570 [marine sediment metagenome]|uniref:Uncharacterized protein n=1 Tax=marine sediment metagenome TaxID=412755 RepID=A0A0F9NLE9_9ZZZZ